MLHQRPVVSSLMYVPLRMVNVQSVMDQLRVRYVRRDEGNFEEDFKEEANVDPVNEEIRCFATAIPGFIGVPRSFGIEKLGISKYFDNTVKLRPVDGVIPKTIRARDREQQEFFDALCGLARGPSPVDIVANARTGTGKTISALYTFATAIKSPTLVTVPTVYLLNQWRKRVAEIFGQEWSDRYLGHIQQDKMDYKDRLLVLGVSASLSRRAERYPLALRRYFSAIFFDEWHKIGTPSMHSILSHYPASVRIGFTATNRRDALLKVCSLHLGRPRIVSKQEVMKPHAFTIKHRTVIPKEVSFSNEYGVVSFLARSLERNRKLARIIYERGVLRGRYVIALSDRVIQLERLMALVISMGADADVCGLLVGQYNEGRKKVKMPREEQERVSTHCQFIFATYGIFAEGSDIPSLDMGVECTPRTNLRQAIGRILRVKAGKPMPEWYSITDTVMVYPDIARTAPLFAPDEPEVFKPLEQWNKDRQASFRDQQATVSELEI